MVESSHITDRPELNGSWAVVTLGNTPADASANLLAPVWINPAIGTGHQEIRPDLGGSTTHPVDLGAI